MMHLYHIALTHHLVAGNKFGLPDGRRTPVCSIKAPSHMIQIKLLHPEYFFDDIMNHDWNNNTEILPLQPMIC